MPEDVNVGDALILAEQDGFRTARAVVKVARLTKTRVVVLDRQRERAFQRGGGFMREIGRGGYNAPTLTIPKPGEVDAVSDENTRYRLVAKLRAALEKSASISTDKLLAMADLLP